MKKRTSIVLLFAAVMMLATGCAQKQVRLMSYNVRNCNGLDSEVDYQRVADVINRIQPDAVAIQELDSMTERYPGVDVLAVLAEKTGMHAVYSPSINYRGGKYGHGMLSRQEPLSYRTVPLPCRSEPRSLLIVEFEDYVYCSTHLSLHKADRITSVDIIVKEIGSMDKPVFFAGDLNASPEEESMQYLSKFFNPCSDITANTFPADEPREVIDYIWIASRQGRQKYSVQSACVVDAPVESDHRPIYVDVQFK